MSFSPEDWAKERLGPQALQPRPMPLPPITGDQRSWAIETVKARYPKEQLRATLTGGDSNRAIAASRLCQCPKCATV